jgi:hypothetical protein
MSAKPKKRRMDDRLPGEDATSVDHLADLLPSGLIEEIGREFDEAENSDDGRPFEKSHAPIFISIYLDDAEDYVKVRRAIVDFIQAHGAEIVHVSPPVYGSVFQRLAARFRRSASRVEDSYLSELIKHRAEAEISLDSDARRTATLTQGLAPIIHSLQNTENAVIRLGAALIVKIDGSVVVQQLTVWQQRRLEVRPNLFKDPRSLLDELTQADEAKVGSASPLVVPSPSLPPDPEAIQG